MAMVDHFRPAASGRFCAGLLTTCNVPCLAHAAGLTIFDPSTRHASQDYPLPATDVIAIAASLYDPVFMLCADGNLLTVAITNPPKPRPEQSPPTKTPSNSALGIFDSDEEHPIRSRSGSRREKERGTRRGRGIGRGRGRGRGGKGKKPTRSKGTSLIDDEASNEDEDEDEDDDEDDDQDQDQDQDGDEELGDYDVVSQGGSDALSNTNANADADVKQPEHGATHTKQHLPECIHKASQPASTPWVHGYRYLCWNDVGVVTSRQDDGYNSVEIEFHDQLFHRPIRFIDETGYSLASISTTGVVFAAPRKETDLQPSSIHFVPLDSWAKVSPWSLVLSLDEEVIGVAIGTTSKYAIIATDQGFLRTISSNNIQGPIVNYPGRFVTMAAHKDTLLLIHADEFSSELGCVFYHTDTLAVLHAGPIGGRFRNTRILWAGLSKNKIAAIFDENHVLHVCNPEAGYVWQPWLDCHEQRERGERVWPVSFSMQELACVFVRDPHGLPEVVPRPILSMLPLRIPLLNVTDALVAPLERALNASQILRNSTLFANGEWTEKEIKKMQISADKHLLELIQIAIKSDKPARVLELCALFLLEKSWGMAVQLAKHNRQIQLADRIEALKDTLTLTPTSTTTSSSSVLHAPTTTEQQHSTAGRPTKAGTTPGTLRVAKMLPVESPGTILANLTPLRTLSREHPAAPSDRAGVAADMPGSPTPLKRPSRGVGEGEQAADENTPSFLANLANPFARISLDPQRTGEKPQTFTDMVKSVQRDTSSLHAGLASEAKEAKKVKKNIAEPEQSRTRKQSDLLLFAKKNDTDPDLHIGVGVGVGLGVQEQLYDATSEDTVIS